MKTRDFDRYTNHGIKTMTIAKIERDGPRFMKYTTVKGTEIYSRYPHDIKLGVQHTVLANYDTHYNRWRLVELKG